ncbi:MAG: hypothetical protein GQ557_00015 [Mycoplasmataceae bacterium]|nr:hypothetical protein [Mycoplasmataceae bacterium]
MNKKLKVSVIFGVIISLIGISLLLLLVVFAKDDKNPLSPELVEINETTESTTYQSETSHYDLYNYIQGSESSITDNEGNPYVAREYFEAPGQTKTYINHPYYEEGILQGIVWGVSNSTSSSIYYYPIDHHDSTNPLLWTLDSSPELITTMDNVLIHHDVARIHDSEIYIVPYNDIGQEPQGSATIFDEEQYNEYILIYNDQTDESVVLDLNEILSLTDEALKSENEFSIVNDNDFLHINGFDYYQGELFLSSRNTNAIYGINIFSDYTSENPSLTNSFSDINPSLEFVISNPTTYDYSEVDSDGEVPITKNGIVFNNDVSDGLYKNNPDYNPHLNSNWDTNSSSGQNIALDFSYNDTIYEREDTSWSNLDDDLLFAGQHDVTVSNQWIEEIGPENIFVDSSFYDPNNYYLTMFDDHNNENRPTFMNYHYNDLGVNDNEHMGKWTNPDVTGKDFTPVTQSFVKMIEVDPVEGTYTLLLNFQVPLSTIKSGATFFTYDNQNMLAVLSADSHTINDDGTDSERYSEYNVYEFDKIDTETLQFSNDNVISSYQEIYTDHDLFKAYPLFWDLNIQNISASNTSIWGT